MKQAALGWFGSKKMPADAQKTGQQLMNSIFKGMEKKEISVKDGIKLMGQPQEWGKQFGTDAAWGVSNAFSKEITKQAHSMALEKLGWDPEKFQFGSKELATYLNSPKSDEAKQAYIKYLTQFRGELLDAGSLENVSVAQTNFQQLANTVGTFGSRFSAAGMSLQMFGSQLSQLSPALQGVGNLLMRVGMAVNTFGMGVSGIGSIITGVGGRIATGIKLARATSVGVIATGTEVASNFIAGFTGGMSAGPIAAIIGAVVVGAFALIKGHVEKKAKEAGEEVRENFEKGFTETNKKIDSLEEYKDRFNELSKGVDQFGHNIDLTSEEYDEYLSISRELQELSPSLIAGYNAEGQAILRKGDALDEVINKLKEERDLSLSEYIDNGSIDKLIKEYNTSDAYKQHHTTIKDTASQYTTVGAFNTETTNLSKAIRQADLEWSEFSQILDELGIGGAASINDLTGRQLTLISDHYTDILNKIKEVNPQIEEEAEEGLKEAFAKTNNVIEDVLTEGAPIVESLRQWMGQEKLDAVGLGLGEEFVSGFNSGIEGLMLEGLTNNWQPEEYKTQLKDYAITWKQLAGETSKYSKIMSEAEKIQEDYLDTIGENNAIENYKEKIEESAVALEELAAAQDTSTIAGQAFAEQCIAQANALRNYAEQGAKPLKEALNSLSDEFASARGAKERFDKAVEGGDYYTAAEGYKSIIETVLDEKNVAGGGSITGWIGAEELLGSDFVDNNSWNEIVNQIERVQTCFEDGADGVLAFNDYLVEAWEAAGGAEGALSGLGEAIDGDFHFNLQNEDLAEYAKLLGMSEDALASLIDKARQWVPMSFAELGEARRSLEQSGIAMVGQTQTEGKSALYTSEKAFKQESGLYGENFINTRDKMAAEQNVKFLTVDNLTSKGGDLGLDKVLSDIGLEGVDRTLDNTVAVLSQLGFDLADTKKILSDENTQLAEDFTTEDIEAAYQEQQFALENPTVAGIASDTGTIANAATLMLAQMGILTDQAKEDIKAATKESKLSEYEQAMSSASTITEHNEAVTNAREQADEYRVWAEAIDDKSNPYYIQLMDAADRLDASADKAESDWGDKLDDAASRLENIHIDFDTITNGDEGEKAFLDSHALELDTAIAQAESGDSSGVLNLLQGWRDSGELSLETINNLGSSIQQLEGVNLNALNSFLTETRDILNSITTTEFQPFELIESPQEDKIAYINSVKELAEGRKNNILLNTELTGQEKAERFINSLNAEFGDGSKIDKQVIIEATAKYANGDSESGQKMLEDAFGVDKAMEIAPQIEVLTSGAVVDQEGLQTALTNEVATLELPEHSASIIIDSIDIEADTSVLDEDHHTALIVDVDPDGSAQGKVDDLESTGSKTINVYMNQAGDWTAEITVSKVEKDARGRNFSIPAHQSLSFGSAAGGMNVPKPKKSTGSQMTALVGEEGFEVGYIPSEQRSVIFGANGPEMTSFPSDTIIYPHNISKDILRRGKGKHQTLGSFQYGTDTVSSGGLRSSVANYTSSSSAVTKAANKVSNAADDTSDAADEAKEAANAVQRVSVWWENMGRRVDNTQRKIDTGLDKIEKKFETFGTTAQSMKKLLTGYKKNLKTSISLNKREIKKAKAELKSLDTGKAAASQSERQAQWENGAAFIEKISYKSGDDTKTVFADLSGYIKKLKDGSYIVDQNALDKIANRDQRKATADAANKAIDDRLSKLTKAEDNLKKAREALAKLADDVYTTFYQWEKSITNVYILSQKLEQLNSRLTTASSRAELQYSKLLAGITDSAEALPEILQALTDQRTLMVNKVNAAQANVGATEQEYLNSISLSTYQNRYNKAKKANGGVVSKEASNDLKAARQALALFNRANGDYEKAVRNLNKKNISEKEYDAIKKVLDDIYSKQNAFLDAQNNAYSTVKEIYDKIEEYQSYISEFETDLLSGLEKETEEQVKHLDKLNSSLTKAYKDLLDEVKRKLDERRKQEDNQKTEDDISKKQQRLAALRADTSGGHQVEIAQLEKEIAEAQQNYQRTLEDQLLEKLQQQGDEAEKQRQRQIELLEAQNEIASELGTNLEQVKIWLSDPEQYFEDIKNAW
ncbi:MAG: hypothetical protein IKP71_08165, partial [Candidatus Riflebacteria bacterium]|nr:hypothetical protein [Candidatus Riflebacteria bacterium]